jgi:hypothetical protein
VRLLGYVSGLLNQRLLLQNEYLITQLLFRWTVVPADSRRNWEE